MSAVLRGWLLLCLVAGSKQLDITEFSVPKTVAAGQVAELRCEYELDASENDAALFVKWWWTRQRSNERSLLFQWAVSRNSPSFQRNNSFLNNGSVVLRNMQPLDSGVYECEVYNINEVRKHENITVFTPGTGPQLNVSAAADHVQIECEAEGVAPLPALDISIQGKVYAKGIVDGPDAAGKYSVRAAANVSADIAVGYNIKCELFFVQEDIAHQPYQDEIKTYTLPGGEAAPAEPAPATTQIEPQAATPPADDPNNGSHLQSAWAALVAAAPIAYLFTLL